MAKETKKETKKENKTLNNINKLIKYYIDYKEEGIDESVIKDIREDYFKRVFNNKNVIAVNEDLEAILDNDKTYKLKDYEKLEDLEELLDSSKETFDFLIYEKSHKKSYVLDVIGFIILMLIGIGFIYSGMILFGIIFILIYIALYLVTFIKHER